MSDERVERATAAFERYWRASGASGESFTDAVRNGMRAAISALDAEPMLEDDDPNPCDVCGEPNLYGSRHRRCGEYVMQQEREAADRERRMRDEIARLRAQVKWLRDYAIHEKFENYYLAMGVMPTQEQMSNIIGGIDGNMAVAADRAVPDGGAD